MSRNLRLGPRGRDPESFPWSLGKAAARELMASFARPCYPRGLLGRRVGAPDLPPTEPFFGEERHRSCCRGGICCLTPFGLRSNKRRPFPGNQGT